MVEGLSLDMLCVLDLGSRGEAIPEGDRAKSGVPAMVCAMVLVVPSLYYRYGKDRDGRQEVYCCGQGEDCGLSSRGGSEREVTECFKRGAG